MKKLYQKIVYANRFLRLARIFHFEKIAPAKLELNSNNKCLLLAPHPDDETMGCGGLLLKHSSIFDVVCLTDGRYGGYDQSNDEIAALRKIEFEKALDKIGILNYCMLKIEDRKLIKNYPVFENINVEKYDYVFIPNYFDQHKDHKAVTILLQKLLRTKKHKVNLKIAFYEVWSPITIPNFYFDISDVIEEKESLIDIYQSQLKHVDFKAGIKSLNLYRGMQFNCRFSEVFSIIDINTFMKL
ncbi:MAG: PIG-L family deacetylase [Candidatus Gastranaerophilales bacterium]|nr:PIG-L family deacetylase [Candidatus Gastranaerophilales bacterium]